jgi:4a-hydroxytetrahydrobiopterin dehydratase
MKKISKKICIPCQGGIPPLTHKEINILMQQLEDGWKVYEKKEIRKEYLFIKYTDAIIFTNKIAKLSEKEGHHPFIHIDYKKVIIILFTHKINGLHENNFILASKCDIVFKLLK